MLIVRYKQNGEKVTKFVDCINSLVEISRLIQEHCLEDLQVINNQIDGIPALAEIFGQDIIKGMGPSADIMYSEAITEGIHNLYSLEVFISQKGALAKKIIILDEEENHYDINFPFNYSWFHKGMIQIKSLGEKE